MRHCRTEELCIPALRIADQRRREKGVGGKQTLPAGGYRLHQILKDDSKIRFRMRRLRIDVQGKALHDDHIAAVQMAAASVRNCITQTQSDGTTRFIGGKFHALRVIREFLAAVLFGTPTRTVCKFVSDAAAIGDILPKRRDTVDGTKAETVVPQPFFICFHRIAERAGSWKSCPYPVRPVRSSI